MEKKHLLYSTALAMAFSSNAFAGQDGVKKFDGTFNAANDVQGMTGTATGFQWNKVSEEEGKIEGNVVNSVTEGTLAPGKFTKTFDNLVPGVYTLTVKGTAWKGNEKATEGFNLIAVENEKNSKSAAIKDDSANLEITITGNNLEIGVEIVKESGLTAVTFDDLVLTCTQNNELYTATNNLIESLTKQISETINEINDMHQDVKDKYLVMLSDIAATVDAQKDKVAEAKAACELYDDKGKKALEGVDTEISDVLKAAEAMEVPYDNKDALVDALSPVQTLCGKVETYINDNSYAKVECSTEIAALKNDLETLTSKVNAYDPKGGQPDNTAKDADDVAIEQLKKALNDLKANAKGIQDAGVANAGAYEDAKASLTDLSDAIEAAKVPYAKYEKATKDKYDFEAIDADFKDLSDALEAANVAKNVKTTYPKGIKESELYKKIAEDLETLKTEAEAFNYNEVAHNEVEALISDAQAAYTAATKELYLALSTKVTLYPSTTEETNVYADLLAKAQSEMNSEILAKINEAKAASKKSYEGNTAAADQEDNKKLIPAVDAMKAVVKKYTDLRTAQDAFYEGDVDAIKAAQAALDKIVIAEALTQYSKTGIQNAINTLVATVNGAYGKYELNGTKEMTTLAQINSDIETLKNNVDESNKDITAAANMTAKIGELREALTKAMANVAEGAEYNSSNYWSVENGNITKAINDLEKNAPKVTTKGEALKYWNDKQGTIEDLTNGIEKLSKNVNAASAKSKEVKGWIADYSKALNDVKKQVKDMSVYQENSDEYTGDLDKSIEKLQVDLNAALDKTSNEHKDALDAITDPNLSAEIEAVAEKVAEAQARYDLDNLKASVTNMMAQAETEVDRTQKDFEDIQTSLTAGVNDSEVTKAEKEWVLAQIDADYNKIQDLINGTDGIQSEIDGVRADLNEAEPNWTADLAKLSTIKTNLSNVNTEIGKLNTTIASYKTSYEEWNKAKKAWDSALIDLTKDVLLNQGPQALAKVSVEKFKGTTGMDAFSGVKSAIDELLKAEETKADGASTVKNTDDQNKVKEYKGILEAATAAIKGNTITDAYEQLVVDEAKARKNWEAFYGTQKVEGVNQVYTENTKTIDTAKKTIETTYADADVQKVYTDRLNAQQVALDGILTIAEGDYKTGDKIGEEAYPAGKAVDTKGARIDAMNDVLAKVQTILDDAKANQEAYNSQKDAVLKATLTDTWQAAWDEISGNYDSQPTMLQAWQNELIEISLEIDALNAKVEANYKAGESVANNQAVADEIAAIKKEITDIQNRASKEYNAKVAEVNEGVDADFTKAITATRDAYNKAVNDIHGYRTVQGSEWGKVIEQAVYGAQEELFPYDQAIVTLTGEEADAYAATKAPNYFEGQEFIDKANKLTEEINSVLAKINKKFADDADAFYNGEKGIKVYNTAHDEALKYISETYKNVEASKYLSAVATKIAEANKAVADAKAADELPLKLGGILQTLDNETSGVEALIAKAKDAAAAADMKKFAQPWKDAIQQAREDMHELTALGDDKTYNDKLSKQLAIINEVYNAKDVTDANYADYKAKLEAVKIEDIKQNVADAQKKNQENIDNADNQNAAKELIAMIDKYAQDWSEVKAKILSNEAYSEKAIAQHQNEIDSFDAIFDNTKEDNAYAQAEDAREGGYAAEDGVKEGLKWLLDETKKQYDALEDMIKATQDDLNATDLDTNKDQTLAKLPKLIEEYNLAAANNPDNETVKNRSLYKQIEGLEDRINKCKTVDEVNKIKLEIQQCYYDIAVINNEAKVKATIDEIDAALTAAQTSYSTEYDKVYEPETEEAEKPALEAIKAKLDELQSDIEQAKKDKTILDEANIIKGKIAAVEQLIKDANADAEEMDAKVIAEKKAQAQKKDNDTNYKTLSEKIEKIEQEDVVALQNSIDESILSDEMKAILSGEWIGDENGGLTSLINDLWDQLNSFNDEIALYDEKNVADIQDQIDGANDVIEWANNTLEQLVANETVYANLSKSIDDIKDQLAKFEAEFAGYDATVKANKDLIAAKAECEGLLKTVTDELESNYKYQTLATQPEGHDKTIGTEIAEEIAELQAKVEAAIANAKKLQEPYNIVAGDANNDGEVNVKDYNQVLAYVLGKADAPEKDTPEFKAANADKSTDGVINVADLTAIANIINGLNYDGTKKSVKGRMPIISDSELSLNVEGETVSVELQNEVEFAAIQMDIKSAMPVVAELTDRTGNLNLFTNELADGTLRVVIASLDGEMIQGEMGAILSLTGCSDVEIINVVAADAKANAHCIAGASSNATAIAGVGAEGESSIFSITGIQQRMQKGINIVRSAAGTVKKVLVK